MEEKKDFQWSKWGLTVIVIISLFCVIALGSFGLKVYLDGKLIDQFLGDRIPIPARPMNYDSRLFTLHLKELEIWQKQEVKYIDLNVELSATLQLFAKVGFDSIHLSDKDHSFIITNIVQVLKNMSGEDFATHIDKWRAWKIHKDK